MTRSRVLAESEMQIAATALENHDVDALARQLFRVRSDLPTLALLMEELINLAAAPADAQWLTEALQERLLNVWFIVFKYARPRELVAAFEYDYFVRATPRHTDQKTLRLMDSAIDQALQIKYFGPYGISLYAHQWLYGEALFLKMRPPDSVEQLMCLREADRLPMEDALLNPPRQRVTEWTVFHAKMRRLAFMILQEVIGMFEQYAEQCGAPVSPFLHPLLVYANHLKTLMWRNANGSLVSLEDVAADLTTSAGTKSLERRVRAFFMPPAEFTSSHLPQLQECAPPLFGAGGTELWHRIIDSHWAHVSSEMTQPNEALFVAMFYNEAEDSLCVVPSSGIYDFIYRPSAQSQLAFFHRVALATPTL